MNIFILVICVGTVSYTPVAEEEGMYTMDVLYHKKAYVTKIVDTEKEAAWIVSNREGEDEWVKLYSFDVVTGSSKEVAIPTIIVTPQ